MQGAPWAFDQSRKEEGVIVAVSQFDLCDQRSMLVQIQVASSWGLHELAARFFAVLFQWPVLRMIR